MTFRTALLGTKNADLIPVQKTMSDRIRIARALCIFFMTFVHVQPGIWENVYDRDAGFFDIVYFILTRLIGLSSVSLLSVVSGYFIVSSLLKVGTAKLIVSKFKTLIVPLIAWNALMLALLIAYALLSGHRQDLPTPDAAGSPTRFWLSRNGRSSSAVVPARPVCLLPVFAHSLCRAETLSRGDHCRLVAFTLFGEDFYLLQRPQLMLFFALGMWLRIAGSSEQSIDRIAGLLTIGLIVMVAVFLAIRIERILIAEMDDTLRLTLDTLLRANGGGLLAIDGTAAQVSAGRSVHEIRTLRVLPVLQPRDPVQFRRHHLPSVFRQLRLGSVSVTFFVLPCLAVLAAVIGLQIINRSRLLLFLFNAGHGVAPLGKAAKNRVVTQNS